MKHAAQILKAISENTDVAFLQNRRGAAQAVLELINMQAPHPALTIQRLDAELMINAIAQRITELKEVAS